MAAGGASAGSARDAALVRPDPPRRAQQARVFFSFSENSAPWAKSPQAESKPDKEKRNCPALSSGLCESEAGDQLDGGGHSAIPLGLVVGEGDGGVVKEAQSVFLADLQA
jgi:hypothetical protein